MKKSQYVVYSKSTGVEIGTGEKRSDARGAEGRVVLRFFKLEEKGTSLRFLVEPWEAFDLSRKMVKVFDQGGKEKLTHTFDGSDGEVVTTLSVEKWERNGRSGCALAIQRDKETVNVPADEGHFLFAAEFLRHLAVTQAWIELPEKG